MPGLDGGKMSKSYGNAIFLREDPAEVTKKIRTMQTDPARVRRTDPGNPERCPVWGLHQIYSDDATREWVWKGCTTAGIGCLECKQPVIDAVIREQAPMHERAQPYLDDPQLVRNIVADGCERARELAEETMRDVREAWVSSTTDDAMTDAAIDLAHPSPEPKPLARVYGEPLPRAAAGPLHPAGGARGVPRHLRGAARPAALPDPPAEHQRARHPDGRAHARSTWATSR